MRSWTPGRHGWGVLAAVAAVYLAIAWPGAGERGVIAEEVTPYLHRYPRVLARADASGVELLPPHDPGTSPGPGWVRTSQWPNLAYRGETRDWPVLIRGYQSALGSYVGVLAQPLLGGGIAGVRRSSALLGLGLLALVFALGRRLGLRPGLAGAAALLCGLSPGLMFFARTGYGFELASRVCMLAALVLVARPRAPTRGQGLAAGLCVAAAIACRATIAATLVPALMLLLVHPRRWTGWRTPLRLLAVGLLAPVVLAAGLGGVVGVYAGTGPGARLELDAMAGRTLTAPAYLAAQLAWVVDARGVLGPLIAGGRAVALELWPLLLGLVGLGLALARWWRARAGDGECMFAAAALGNALCGAWLYGDPAQFQLGMALEPLFVLALAHQLQALQGRWPRAAAGLLALLIAGRAAQLGALLRAEAHTANPMLSGAAQRGVAAALQGRGAGPDAVVTTTYNHVGVLETWSGGQVTPIHAHGVLHRPRRGDAAPLLAAWRALLRAYPVRFVVLTEGVNLFEGPFTDSAAVQTALQAALDERGQAVVQRWRLACESGDPCLGLWELAPGRR